METTKTFEDLAQREYVTKPQGAAAAKPAPGARRFTMQDVAASYYGSQPDGDAGLIEASPHGGPR